MNVSDALVTALRDWGVRYVFGVSGANIEHLHDSIHRLGDGRLESVMTKTESGAAFMADGHARVHKTLGVCCSTSGGGMMNLAVGVAEAYAESVPMLAIVGQAPRALEGRGAFQDGSGLAGTVDAAALFGAIAKSVTRVRSAQTFHSDLLGAVRSAMSGRRGPAVLLVPRDVFELEAPPRPEVWPCLASVAAPVPAETDAVEALFEALRAAKRPVLLLGTGVERSADAQAVRQFAIRAGIPVVTTMASLGTFDNDRSQYLGCVGVAGHPSAHRYVNEQADLLVAVGAGLDVMVRAPITRGLARAQVALVNVAPERAEAAIEGCLVVRGDAGLVFRELLERHPASPFTHAAPAEYELTRYAPQCVEPVDAQPGLLQSKAIEAIEPYLLPDGHVLFDAGNCAAAALHALRIPRGSSSTIALGMGGMGYAIAAAVGAQLGSPPGARTTVLCGDGAFLMTGFEIHTAIDLRLPILFVVFNNQQHGMCATRQRLFFEDRRECVDYAPIDVATVVRGLDPEGRAWVGRAATDESLQSCLAEYHADASGPGILELVLAHEELPPFSPFLDGDAPTYAVDADLVETSAA